MAHTGRPYATYCQRITTVSVGNGAATYFWHDIWLMDEPLAVKLPALLSHFNGQVASVRDVVDGGLHNLLQRRLSNQATHELQLLDTAAGSGPRRLARPTVQPFPGWQWHRGNEKVQTPI